MKLNKDPYYYRFTSAVTSAFATDSHILHRQRRKGFDRFLISSAIRDLESLVRKSVLKLCARIEEHRGGGKPVILSSALRSLATDVISQYVLPQGFDLLSSRDFGEDYNNVNRKFSGLTSYQRHFPFVIPMVMKIPTSLLKLTASPGMIQMLDFQGVGLLTSQLTHTDLSPAQQSSSRSHSLLSLEAQRFLCSARHIQLRSVSQRQNRHPHLRRSAHTRRCRLRDHRLSTRARILPRSL